MKNQYVCHNCGKEFTKTKDSVRFKTIEGVYRYFCTWFCK